MCVCTCHGATCLCQRLVIRLACQSLYTPLTRIAQSSVRSAEKLTDCAVFMLGLCHFTGTLRRLPMRSIISTQADHTCFHAMFVAKLLVCSLQGAAGDALHRHYARAHRGCATRLLQVRLYAM
jgi:hypothetical protein